MSAPNRRVERISKHLAPQPTAASKTFKVAVVGAAGGIGQPLSLLMKASPYVSELSLYDVVGTPGVSLDGLGTTMLTFAEALYRLTPA